MERVQAHRLGPVIAHLSGSQKCIFLICFINEIEKTNEHKALWELESG